VHPVQRPVLPLTRFHPTSTLSVFSHSMDCFYCSNFTMFQHLHISHNQVHLRLFSDTLCLLTQCNYQHHIPSQHLNSEHHGPCTFRSACCKQSLNNQVVVLTFVIICFPFLPHKLRNFNSAVLVLVRT